MRADTEVTGEFVAGMFHPCSPALLHAPTTFLPFSAGGLYALGGAQLSRTFRPSGHGARGRDLQPHPLPTHPCRHAAKLLVGSAASCPKSLLDMYLALVITGIAPLLTTCVLLPSGTAGLS